MVILLVESLWVECISHLEDLQVPPGLIRELRGLHPEPGLALGRLSLRRSGLLQLLLSHLGFDLEILCPGREVGELLHLLVGEEHLGGLVGQRAEVLVGMGLHVDQGRGVQPGHQLTAQNPRGTVGKLNGSSGNIQI